MGLLYALRDGVPKPHIVHSEILSLSVAKLFDLYRSILNDNPAVMLDLLEKPEFTVALKVTHCCVRYLLFFT